IGAIACLYELGFGPDLDAAVTYGEVGGVAPLWPGLMGNADVVDLAVGKAAQGFGQRQFDRQVLGEVVAQQTAHHGIAFKIAHFYACFPAPVGIFILAYSGDADFVAVVIEGAFDVIAINPAFEALAGAHLEPVSLAQQNFDVIAAFDDLYAGIAFAGPGAQIQVGILNFDRRIFVRLDANGAE